MNIQRTSVCNPAFQAKLKITGDTRILSKKDIKDYKKIAQKFGFPGDKITIDIGRLSSRTDEATRDTIPERNTVITMLINGIVFVEKCNKCFDDDVKTFLRKFFNELLD